MIWGEKEAELRNFQVPLFFAHHFSLPAHPGFSMCEIYKICRENKHRNSPIEDYAKKFISGAEKTRSRAMTQGCNFTGRIGMSDCDSLSQIVREFSGFFLRFPHTPATCIRPTKICTFLSKTV
jgi:hypothetical protein